MVGMTILPLKAVLTTKDLEIYWSSWALFSFPKRVPPPEQRPYFTFICLPSSARENSSADILKISVLGSAP